MTCTIITEYNIHDYVRELRFLSIEDTRYKYKAKSLSKGLATLRLNYKYHHGSLMYSISLEENYFLSLPMNKYHKKTFLTH